MHESGVPGERGSKSNNKQCSLGEAERGVFKSGLINLDSLHSLVQNVSSFFSRRVIRPGARTMSSFVYQISVKFLLDV